MRDGDRPERDDLLGWLEESVQNDPEARRAAAEEEVHLHLARALRKARLAAGMTQSQVAEAAGLRQSAVSRLESPNHNPTIASVVRYLTAVRGELALSVQAGGRRIPATPAAKRVKPVPDAP